MADEKPQRVQINLTPEVLQRLDELRNSIGQSRSEILRHHLATFLASYYTQDDARSRLLLKLASAAGASSRVDVAHRADVASLTVLELERAAVPPLQARQDEPTKAVFLSVFISYGGPDEAFARTIYRALVAKGVNVFFFPETATPGQRLHRTMSDGVHSYDRVVLICSEQSLNRPGVLNEIEQVLAREAAEGGAELLLPISIDDYVFKKWSPPRADIARQVQQRVTIRFSSKKPGSASYAKQFARLLAAITVKL
jgi:hypothetical protein